MAACPRSPRRPCSPTADQMARSRSAQTVRRSSTELARRVFADPAPPTTRALGTTYRDPTLPSRIHSPDHRPSAPLCDASSSQTPGPRSLPAHPAPVARPTQPGSPTPGPLIQRAQPSSARPDPPACQRPSTTAPSARMTGLKPRLDLAQVAQTCCPLALEQRCRASVHPARRSSRKKTSDSPWCLPLLSSPTPSTSLQLSSRACPSRHNRPDREHPSTTPKRCSRSTGVAASAQPPHLRSAL